MTVEPSWGTSMRFPKSDQERIIDSYRRENSDLRECIVELYEELTLDNTPKQRENTIEMFKEILTGMGHILDDEGRIIPEMDEDECHR